MARRALCLTLLAACGRLGFDMPTDGGTEDGSITPTGAVVEATFAQGTLGGFAFTRGSVATYVGADRLLHVAPAGEPRFDHDPITGAPRGLLIEGPGLNLTSRSDQLDSDSDWFTNGNLAVTANAGIAPDGTMTAELLADMDSNDARRGTGTIVPNDTADYTFSIFLKRGSTNLVSFAGELLDGSQQIQTGFDIDLDTGTALTSPPAAKAFGVEPYGNGWYRVWLTLTNNGSGNRDAIMSVWGYLTEPAFLGSVYAWGGQTEASSVPTSYIPSPDASPAARSADVVVVDNPTWYSRERMTVFVEAAVAKPRDDIQPAACFANNATLDIECLARQGTTDSAVFFSDSGALLAGSPWTDAEPRALAATWTDGIPTLHESGERSSPALPLTDTPAFDLLVLGSAGAVFLGGHVTRFAAWPRVLGDDELQALGVQ